MLPVPLSPPLFPYPSLLCFVPLTITPSAWPRWVFQRVMFADLTSRLQLRLLTGHCLLVRDLDTFLLPPCPAGQPLVFLSLMVGFLGSQHRGFSSCSVVWTWAISPTAGLRRHIHTLMLHPGQATCLAPSTSPSAPWTALCLCLLGLHTHISQFSLWGSHKSENLLRRLPFPPLWASPYPIHFQVSSLRGLLPPICWSPSPWSLHDPSRRCVVLGLLQEPIAIHPDVASRNQICSCQPVA